MKATIAKTKYGTIYVLIGVEVRCATELDRTIPLELICINQRKMTVVQNPKKEMLSLGPAGALDNEYSPKSINLVGVHFSAESIVSVETVDYITIEPTYQ